MNTTIATLLEQKDGAVFTIPTTVTVAEAVQEMNAHKVGSVLVMDGLRLAGIFTERDVLRRVVGAKLRASAGLSRRGGRARRRLAPGFVPKPWPRQCHD